MVVVVAVAAPNAALPALALLLLLLLLLVESSVPVRNGLSGFFLPFVGDLNEVVVVELATCRSCLARSKGLSVLAAVALAVAGTAAERVAIDSSVVVPTNVAKGVEEVINGFGGLLLLLAVMVEGVVALAVVILFVAFAVVAAATIAVAVDFAVDVVAVAVAIGTTALAGTSLASFPSTSSLPFALDNFDEEEEEGEEEEGEARRGDTGDILASDALKSKNGLRRGGMMPN